MSFDLNSLPTAIRTIVEAARKLDRENLDEVQVHPCDVRDDTVRRQKLCDERRALSDALLGAGLTISYNEAEDARTDQLVSGLHQHIAAGAVARRRLA